MFCLTAYLAVAFASQNTKDSELVEESKNDLKTSSSYGYGYYGYPSYGYHGGYGYPYYGYGHGYGYGYGGNIYKFQTFGEKLAF